MICSKIMVGDNALSRLNFEGYIEGSKGVLVIYDMSADICGAKRRIKKSFAKDTPITFEHIKSANVAQSSEVDKCYLAASEAKADLVICVGGAACHNVGKAIKLMIRSGVKSFEELAASEQSADYAADVKLILIVVASGNHQNMLNGFFEVEQNDTLCRYNKKCAVADAVMVDGKLVDKLGKTAMNGLWLSAALTALISIGADGDEAKIGALTAWNILTGEQLGGVNLIAAEMYAGEQFADIPGNYLNEFICSAKYLSGENFGVILCILLRGKVDKIVGALSAEDLSALGYCVDETDEQSVVSARAELCTSIESKMMKYFEDKDIPQVLGEAGLTSGVLEEIFDDLGTQYDSSDVASFKDLVYACY